MILLNVETRSLTDFPYQAVLAAFQILQEVGSHSLSVVEDVDVVEDGFLAASRAGRFHG
jgi:hypothetical protein